MFVLLHLIMQSPNYYIDKLVFRKIAYVVFLKHFFFYAFNGIKFV